MSQIPRAGFQGNKKIQKKILVEKGGCHPSSVRKLEASCIKCKPRRDNGRNTRKSVHRDQPAGFVTKSWVRMLESKFSWNSPPHNFHRVPPIAGEHAACRNPRGFQGPARCQVHILRVSDTCPSTIFIGYPLLPVNRLHAEILEDCKGLQDAKVSLRDSVYKKRPP